MSERDRTRPDMPGLGPYGQDSTTPPAREQAAPATAPDYSTRPVAFRGPESLGGLLLLLAGIAAAISLPLDWIAGSDVTGWNLVRSGLGAPGAVFDTGLWQPVTIVLGGGVLFLLGLLMWLPARTHRALGLLALLVSAAAAAAVLVPLAEAAWDVGVFDIGFFFGIAVPVLGLLGAIKALLTGPKRGRR